MVKCKYCGFDPESDSLYAEGAPCGYNGCMIFTCCTAKWYEHVELAHPEHYKHIKYNDPRIIGEKKYRIK